MEYTCSECLGRAETSHQNCKFCWWFLGKNVTWKDLKGQVKRKHISPKKCLKIQTKDNPQAM